MSTTRSTIRKFLKGWEGSYTISAFMIIVTGSLAFDHIMDFPGRFSDHILPDKIHILNVSFLVDSLKRQRGGVAGNIAHNLALLGERPAILAAAGKDFREYENFLRAEGIETSYIKMVENEYTASAFITTDLADNQITGFYPGAMARADSLSLRDFDSRRVDLVIIAADKPSIMIKYAQECRELEIPYVFDPSQQIVRLSNDELRAGIAGAKVLIGNDYEIQLIMNRLGVGEKELLTDVEVLISTLGEKGSLIHTRDGVIKIPIARPREILDPTGAGDAYRAGILKGLLRGWPLEKTGRVAALAAVYAIEAYGAQEHQYSQSQFKTRYLENFGEELQL